LDSAVYRRAALRHPENCVRHSNVAGSLTAVLLVRIGERKGGDGPVERVALAPVATVVWLLLANTGSVGAQDLAPKAYSASRVRAAFLVGGLARSSRRLHHTLGSSNQRVKLRREVRTPPHVGPARSWRGCRSRTAGFARARRVAAVEAVARHATPRRAAPRPRRRRATVRSRRRR
jgi:hypothetical protein